MNGYVRHFEISYVCGELRQAEGEIRECKGKKAGQGRLEGHVTKDLSLPN